MVLIAREAWSANNIEIEPPGEHGATTRIVLACWHHVFSRWLCPHGRYCNSVHCIGMLAATRPRWQFYVIEVAILLKMRCCCGILALSTIVFCFSKRLMRFETRFEQMVRAKLIKQWDFIISSLFDVVVKGKHFVDKSSANGKIDRRQLLLQLSWSTLRGWAINYSSKDKGGLLLTL